MTLPSRRVLLVVLGALLVLAIIFGLPWLSPTRGVERTWKNLVAAIEDNDQEELATYLADNYRDGFGLSREEALQLAATIRGQFLVCTVRLEQPEVVMDANTGRAARTRALVRLGGQGTQVATAAIQASTSSQTPTVFHWRRASWKPWDWKLTSVENPEAARAITRFEREAGRLGL